MSKRPEVLSDEELEVYLTEWMISEVGISPLLLLPVLLRSGVGSSKLHSCEFSRPAALAAAVQPEVLKAHEDFLSAAVAGWGSSLFTHLDSQTMQVHYNLLALSDFGIVGEDLHAFLVGLKTSKMVEFWSDSPLGFQFLQFSLCPDFYTKLWDAQEELVRQDRAGFELLVESQKEKVERLRTYLEVRPNTTPAQDDVELLARYGLAAQVTGLTEREVMEAELALLRERAHELPFHVVGEAKQAPSGA